MNVKRIGKAELDLAEYLKQQTLNDLARLSKEQRMAGTLETEVPQDSINPTDFELIIDRGAWADYINHWSKILKSYAMANYYGDPELYPCFVTTFQHGAVLYHRFLYPVDAADLLDAAEKAGVRVI